MDLFAEAVGQKVVFSIGTAMSAVLDRQQVYVQIILPVALDLLTVSDHGVLVTAPALKHIQLPHQRLEAEPHVLMPMESKAAPAVQMGRASAVVQRGLLHRQAQDTISAAVAMRRNGGRHIYLVVAS